MELQGLQEALKVELQCHQNQTLCKGLNELQNGQKLAVRSCPVGSTKPLSLIKPPSQGIAISVVPAKAPVSMVTAHINGQKAAGPEPLQASPINLQAVGAGVVPLSGGRRAGELLAPSQMLGTLTALPIKVPQVSSLHRLAGQAATVLPQVRPKTQIPSSLPHSPCQELQPLSLQRVTAVVSPKSQAPTLPTANSTFSSDHQQVIQSNASPSAGPDLGAASQHASAGPGVAYAIIAASPATGNGVSAVSEAVKVIIIQPQAPSSTDGSPADLPSPEAPTVKSPLKKKKEEDPEKIAFMVALGLVTTEQLEEIQTKRQERKRRSTANPAYSGLFEPERKRLPSHYLNSSLYLSARGNATFGPNGPPYSAGLHGPEGSTPRFAARHSGVARPHQNAHQAHPARPAGPGHHDDHRHAPPAVDETHQHRRHGGGAVDRAAAAGSGRRRQLDPTSLKCFQTQHLQCLTRFF